MDNSYHNFSNVIQDWIVYDDLKFILSVPFTLTNVHLLPSYPFTLLTLSTPLIQYPGVDFSDVINGVPGGQ
jgi:hypothetical protein